MLADGILSVDFGDVAMALLYGLLEFRLLGLLVFAGFGGLSLRQVSDTVIAHVYRLEVEIH